MLTTTSQLALQVQTELTRINLAYLTLARFVAQKSPGEACHRFRFRPEVADELLRASPTTLQALATSEQVLACLELGVDDIKAAETVIQAAG